MRIIKIRHLKIALSIALFLIALSARAQYQDPLSIKGGYILPGVIVDGDTIPYTRIKPVVILPPLEFKSHNEYLRYRKLVRNIKRVYPYSLIARDIFRDIEYAMDSIKNPREQKKYIKQKDQELQDRYTEELKKLTITQGQLLIKLIDRELGMTSYEVVKELRGSVSAFMWQSLARLFGSSLKSEFDEDGEDALIERIIILIENGQL